MSEQSNNFGSYDSMVANMVANGVRPEPGELAKAARAQYADESFANGVIKDLAAAPPSKAYEEAVSPTAICFPPSIPEGEEWQRLAAKHPGLNFAQVRFVELERQVATYEYHLKPLREALKEAKQAVILESGVRSSGRPYFFQDGYGVVHKLAPREWVTLPVEPIGFEHTRRPELGEQKGSLSEKAAKEAGYTPVIKTTEAI